jgi:hypothetical protein
VAAQVLEHFPAKWKPGFPRKTDRQTAEFTKDFPANRHPFPAKRARHNQNPARSPRMKGRGIILRDNKVPAARKPPSRQLRAAVFHGKTGRARRTRQKPLAQGKTLHNNGLL